MMYHHYCVANIVYAVTFFRTIPNSSNNPFVLYVCPTRYRTRHFFNSFTTDEDIATKLEADYRHIPLHFSHNERTPVQISLQYLHWCYIY